ncbi:MAG: glycosyltransferase family 4 protein [Candidatus Methylacidiphilales bacterium]
MTPTTRILHLIHHDDQGGAPVAMVHQLRYFAGKCENFAVFGRGTNGPGRIETWCKESGASHAMPWLGNKLLLPIALLQTWRIIRQWRPDLILLYGQWGAPVGALAAWLAGARRCIYNSQWPAYYQDFSPVKAAINFLAEAVPARICRRVIALSPGNFNQYFIRGWDMDPATGAPSGKLVLLPNCTDTASPSRESVELWRNQWNWGLRTYTAPGAGETASAVHVVSLGRLVPQKRMDWLMRAWAMRKTDAPKAHLWIVGGGDVLRYRELARQLGIADTCTLTGFETDGWKRLAAADIFALTSRSEGLPFVVIEAMAAGIPTVASKVDGIEGTVRDGLDGFLIPPTDLSAFAAALERLIADAALRQEMGTNARAQSRLYECSTVLPRYEALYDEVLNEAV